MSDLATFQRNFAAAILEERETEASIRSLAFSVYRNTSARGAVEALRATYATVNELLGEDGFTHVALEYRQVEPPQVPVLSDYGSGFACFLSRQPWACELPYLADVARLDWLWLESFLSADAHPLPKPVELRSRITLHPATRVAWLGTPALTIWQAHRNAAGFDELEPEWREEGALLTRRGLQVVTQPIDRACHYLLLISAGSPRVEQCVAAVAEAHPRSNVSELLHQCVAAGALIIE